MKIRNGFVSNSSSSSFIVAVKSEDKAKTKITVTFDVDLKDYLEHPIVKTVKELKRIYKEELYYDIDNENNDEDCAYMIQFLKAKKAIESGKMILIGSFSSESGEGVEGVLCSKGLPKKNKNFTIIYNEGGY